MFERRDPSKLPAPGTHAPDFITPLAYASLIIPVLFLVLAGIWIAVRFGRSNLNPADTDLNAQEGDDEFDDEDEDEEDEKDGAAAAAREEKRGTTKSNSAKAAGKDGQLQPLLERDEDEDEDEEEEQEDEAKPKPSRKERNPADAQAPTPTPSSQWKLRPGYSSTEKKSSS